MEDASKLMDSLSKLLGAVIWPALIMIVVFRYKQSFALFLDTLSEISFKFSGLEASFRRKEAATKALVEAAVARSEIGSSPEVRAKEVKAAATAVEAVTPRTLRLARRAKVLWVDDRPGNNVRERQAMEALGIDFFISKSTDDALNKMRDQRFDVIISDMGRPPDPQAGYTLLDKIRESGDITPLVFYAGSRSAEHVAESRRRGALGCTNRPDELFDYVLTAIGG